MTILAHVTYLEIPSILAWFALGIGTGVLLSVGWRASALSSRPAFLKRIF